MSYVINKSSIIDSLPLFAELSFLQKRFVASKIQIVEFNKGELIYEEGGPPDYFYCMVSGRVEIYHPPRRGRKRQKEVIEYVRRGDYFGSISALTGRPHTVSAKAVNDSAVLKIEVKEFDAILQRVPQLAIMLSRSLSRRLGRKAHKEIFESKIIAVCGVGGSLDISSYTQALAQSIKKESRKKVLHLAPGSISHKKKVSSKLDSFTGDYHYIVVEVQPRLDEVGLEILKQADICHILSPSDKASLRKASSFLKELEGTAGRYMKQYAYVILKEDSFYPDTSYLQKRALLSKDVFASLPQDMKEFKKAMRRIAREAAGVRVGLALGSGAAMGLAHIGVLKVLEKEKIAVDIISAASVGALIAALWAAGHPADEIEKFVCGFKSRLRTLFLLDPTLPIRGLIRGNAVRRALSPYLGNKTFSDIKVPLKIVACDIRNGSEVVIDSGKLIDAVMASIAIPGVFEPVEYNGAQLVDGGIVNPVPISVLSKAGVKRIIAVNTLPSPEDIVRIGRKRLNIYDIIVNSFQAMEFSIAAHPCEQADVYIHPIPKLADWYEFYKAKLFIQTGQIHTRRALSEIKRLYSRFK